MRGLDYGHHQGSLLQHGQYKLPKNRKILRKELEKWETNPVSEKGNEREQEIGDESRQITFFFQHAIHLKYIREDGLLTVVRNSKSLIYSIS